MPISSEQIRDYLNNNPNAITLDIAAHFQCPEGEIICALPPEFVQVFPSKFAEIILKDLPNWGIFTVIVEKEGCIFEIKDRFPNGVFGRGYYNLNMKGDDGAIHGHLKLDNISCIAFVSLPFRGKESYNIAFIGHNGQTIFKVYLGRNEERQLFPQQVEMFHQFIALHKESL